MERSAIQALYEREPLLAFSVVTSMQVRALKSVSEDILLQLDTDMKTPGQIEGRGLTGVYAQTWLWVLGAYEVIRTMAQAKECFSPVLAEKVVSEKRKLARLRMPLAKQEYERERGHAGTEAIFSIVDTRGRDVGFVIAGERFMVRQVLREFNSLIESIRLADVLARHDSKYGV